MLIREQKADFLYFRNMKKGFILQSGAVLMALLVLCASFSFTLNKHFCGEFLVDSSWFVEADTCGLAMDDHSDSHHDHSRFEGDCCEDLTVFFGGQKELKNTITDITFDQQVFLLTFMYSRALLFQPVNSGKMIFLEYSPPPLIQDFPILNQTFLI